MLSEDGPTKAALSPAQPPRQAVPWGLLLAGAGPAALPQQLAGPIRALRGQQQQQAQQQAQQPVTPVSPAMLPQRWFLSGLQARTSGAAEAVPGCAAPQPADPPGSATGHAATWVLISTAPPLPATPFPSHLAERGGMLPSDVAEDEDIWGLLGSLTGV